MFTYYSYNHKAVAHFPLPLGLPLKFCWLAIFIIIPFKICFEIY